MNHLAIAFFAIAVVVGSFFYSTIRARSILLEWADRENLSLLDARMVWFPLATPFWWRCGRGQVVMRIKIEIRDEGQFEGWALCGSYWAGMWSNRVEVAWIGARPEYLSSVWPY